MTPGTLRQQKINSAFPARHGLMFVAAFAVVAFFATAHLAMFVHQEMLEQQWRERAAVQEFVNEVRLQCGRAFPLGGERQAQCIARVLELAEVRP